jgi:spore coat polysaccharide biosynthesis predicted glycosyltransferase SpsG
MRIAFRTEGNPKQGMGDVMSSLAIAEQCRDADDAVLFVISGGEAEEAIRARGYAVAVAPDESGRLDAIRRFGADVVVINMLNTPQASVRAMSGATPLVVTIDDNGPGAREAGLRINVLYHTPDAVTGLEYIALREEFQRAHDAERTVRAQAEELLLMQGGADTYGFLPRILDGVGASVWRGHVTLITGPAFVHENALRASLDRSPLDVDVIRNCSTMADVMRRADMAISAGGISMFELACVGTPSIIVCAEHFEEETASRLDRAGVVRNLGFGGALSDAAIAEAVDTLAGDVEKRREMARCGRELIDGKGAVRIAQRIRSAVAERKVAR